MNQATTHTTINTTGPRRGDAMPDGGRFVGQAPRSTQWVSYEGEADFAALCERFDRYFSPQARRRAAVA